MTAIWHHQVTGEGQQVDVSIQECVISPTSNVLHMWDVNKVEFHRLGGCMLIPATGVRVPINFKCKDGSVTILVQGGTEAHVSSMKRLVAWMDEEGMADDWLKKIDWKTDYDSSVLGQDLVDRVEAAYYLELRQVYKKQSLRLKH